jgi:hypothetical protein
MTRLTFILLLAVVTVINAGAADSGTNIVNYPRVSSLSTNSFFVATDQNRTTNKTVSILASNYVTQAQMSVATNTLGGVMATDAEVTAAIAAHAALSDTIAELEAIFGVNLLTSTEGDAAYSPLTIDASGFNGNLTTSDNTLQEVAQKLDDLTIAAGSGDDVHINDANVTHPNFEDSATVTWSVTGTNVTATAVGGSGDVTGPSSSTNNNLVRFDGTTGKLVQDSDIIVDDSGNLETPGEIAAASFRGTGATADSRVDVPDDDGSHYFGLQANDTTTTSVNLIGPAAPFTGIPLFTASGTNFTMSAAAQDTDYSLVTIGNDPDLSTEGRLGWDSNGDVLRGYDGANQVAIGRKIEAIHVTVIAPNDLADAQRDAFLFWSNESGMSFVVTGWKGWSGTDDTTLNVEEVDADGVSNNATVDAVELATGTGPYTGSDTTITGATIENGHLLVLDFDDTDTPTYVKITIYGYYAADVN